MYNKLVLVNFANGEPFEKYRRYSSWSGKYIGKADRVIEYTLNDIDPEYKSAHRNIFNYKRGCGLWLWKPYFILKALNEINDGDWLFYCDSGAFFIRSIRKLVKCAESNGDDIMLFELPLLDRQFTKKECYEILGIPDFSQNQILATYLLLKKTDTTINFIKEWLVLCEDERLISPNRFCEYISEFDDFVAHREDQSLLSLLCIKHNINRYRDCSDYGMFPHKYKSLKWSLCPKTYSNSSYTTIILCNRKIHPLKYWVKFLLRSLLRCLK